MTKSQFSILISPILFLLFLFTFWTALDFNKMAGYFPLFLSGLGMFFAVLSFVDDLWKYKKRKKSGQVEDENAKVFGDIETTHNFRTAALNFLWLVIYLCLIIVVGFIIASILFLFVFLINKAKFSWLKTIISTGFTIAFILFLGNLLNLKWPAGILSSIF